MKFKAVVLRGLLISVTLMAFLLGYNVKTALAAAGFFQTYIILNIRSEGNTYYDAGADTANPDFLNANLGTFTTDDTLILKGGQAKTYKNNSSDVQYVYLDYCVYPSGSSCSGGFSSVPLSWQSDLDPCSDGACDQQWEKANENINILQGLTPGNYILAVYFHANTNNINCPSVFYDNRGGNNYTASFTLNDPTAVDLVAFTAEPQGNAIRVSWETAQELDNLGFDLYRGESAAGPWTRLNAELIPAQNPGATFGATYEWLDVDVTPDVTYFYRLEDVDLNGVSTFHGPESTTATTPSAVRITGFSARGPAFGLPLVLAALGLGGLARKRRS